MSCVQQLLNDSPSSDNTTCTTGIDTKLDSSDQYSKLQLSEQVRGGVEIKFLETKPEKQPSMSKVNSEGIDLKQAK